MPELIQVLLASHVASGCVALGSAFIAIGAKKGRAIHRRMGTVFFWAMVGVGATAIPVTFIRPDAFLFFIALFSFYMAFAGYRRGRSGFVQGQVDVMASVAMVVTAVAMVGWGLVMVTSADELGWALIAFGGLGLSFGTQDYVATRRLQAHVATIQVHVSRMLGGTIATITAVLVTQVAPLVDSPLWRVVVWLSPTIIITPLIAIWVARIARTNRYELFGRRHGAIGA